MLFEACREDEGAGTSRGSAVTGLVSSKREVAWVFKSSYVFPEREGSLRWRLHERPFVGSLPGAKRRGVASQPSGNLVLSWVRFHAFFSTPFTLSSLIQIWEVIRDARAYKNLTNLLSWRLTHGVDHVTLFRHIRLDRRRTQVRIYVHNFAAGFPATPRWCEDQQQEVL